MSSLNPFSARRERKEQQLQAKLEQLQQQQGGAYGGELMSSGSLAAAGGHDEVEYEKEDFDRYLPKAESPSVDAWTPPASPSYQYYEPPSRFRQCMWKLQNGAMIGGALGSAIGFMYGTYAAIAYRHILYLPISVVSTAAGFGFFLACGTVIRCEELPLLELADAERTPIGRPHDAVAHRPVFDVLEPPHAFAARARAATTHRERSAVVHAILSRDD